MKATRSKAQRFAGYCEGHLLSAQHELASATTRRGCLQGDATALRTWAAKIAQGFPGDTAQRAAAAIRDACEEITACLSRPGMAGREGARSAVTRALDRVQEWAAMESEGAP